MRSEERKNKPPEEKPRSREWARKGVKPYVATSEVYSLEGDKEDYECKVYVSYIVT